jgi:hypothetical protein
MPLCFSHELHSLHTMFLFGCCQSCAIHLYVRSRPRQTLSTYLLMRLLSLFDGIIHLAFVTHIYWARIVFGSYPHPLILVEWVTSKGSRRHREQRRNALSAARKRHKWYRMWPKAPIYPSLSSWSEHSSLSQVPPPIVATSSSRPRTL